MPKLRSNKEYASAAGAPCTPPTPKRLRSDGGPFWSQYGRYRPQFYRHHARFFFCHHCDLWDNEVRLGKKRIQMNSRTYKCEAKHTSFSHPTHCLPNFGMFVPSKNPAVRQHERPTSDSDRDNDPGDENRIDEPAENVKATVMFSSSPYSLPKFTYSTFMGTRKTSIAPIVIKK
jgi:hypothetical protein